MLILTLLCLIKLLISAILRRKLWLTTKNKERRRCMFRQFSILR